MNLPSIVLADLPSNLVTLPGPERLAVIAYARAQVDADRARIVIAIARYEREMEREHREDVRQTAAEARHRERFPDEPPGTY
jgi:hypothetical protein